MTTPEVNENCHYVQNDPHRRKIKLEKFHFDILWCSELLRKVSEGRGGVESTPLGEIGFMIIRPCVSKWRIK